MKASIFSRSCLKPEVVLIKKIYRDFYFLNPFTTGPYFFSVRKIPRLFRFSQLIFNADFKKWFVIYHAFFEYCAKNTNDGIFRLNVV